MHLPIYIWTHGHFKQSGSRGPSREAAARQPPQPILAALALRCLGHLCSGRRPRASPACLSASAAADGLDRSLSAEMSHPNTLFRVPYEP